MANDGPREVICCLYNHGIDCGSWASTNKRCDFCGWNPGEDKFRKSLMPDEENWREVTKIVDGKVRVCKSLILP